MALAGAGQAQTSLNIGYVPAYPGTVASVPVNLRPTAGGAVALQFDVGFNNGTVSAQDAVRGDRLTNHIVKSRQIAPGVERVLIYSLNNAVLAGSNVTVAGLPFAVDANEHVSSGPLTPSRVVLGKADATAVSPVSANSGTIFVRAVNLLPDGQAQFFMASQPDQTYVIQATTNFVRWVDILTNTATGTFMDLLDPDALFYPQRFYRSATFEAAPGPIGGGLLVPNERH